MKGNTSLFLRRFCGLGVVVGGVAAAAFAPFLTVGQLPQLAKRLFPVSRGLLHAYWAPNFWALYALADKCIATVRAHVSSDGMPSGQTATLTGGLVGEASFSVLPNISSITTMVLVVLGMFPCTWSLWRHPHPLRFPRAVVVCTLTSFIFGYHVHEKAILMTIVPLAILCCRGEDGDTDTDTDIKDFLFLTIVGTFSLFPLLIRKEEYGIKIGLLITYLLIAIPWMQRTKGNKKTKGGFSVVERVYLWGLLPLELYCLVGHPLLFGTQRFPFLPLMATSVYCGVGVCGCWGRMVFTFPSYRTRQVKTKKKVF